MLSATPNFQAYKITYYTSNQTCIKVSAVTLSILSVYKWYNTQYSIGILTCITASCQLFEEYMNACIYAEHDHGGGTQTIGNS